MREKSKSIFSEGNTVPFDKHKCIICGETFDREMLLYAHITGHSREIMVSETVGNSVRHPGEAFSLQEIMNPNKENRSPRERWGTPGEEGYEETGEGFGCEKCSRRYKTKRSLLWHVRTAHGCEDFEYEGGVCGVMGMERRLKGVQSGRVKVGCEVCGKSVWKTHLKSHKRSHGEGKEVKCSVCGLPFQTKGELRTHLGEHVARDSGYECDTCKECFPTKKVLLLHLVKAHLGEEKRETGLELEEEKAEKVPQRKGKKKVKMEKPFKCDVENCQYATSQVHLLKAHKFKHNPFYKCVTCQEKLPSRQELKAHMATHGERPYKCDQCSKCYKDKHGLGWHKKVQHDPSRLKFTCELCGKTYPFDSLLTQHINLTHATEKQSVCDICGKNVSKTYLPMHRRTHGEKQYTCDVCQKTFLEKAYLKRHKMIHTGEKPYVCSVCGNLFRQHSTLTIHMRTHTGDRPYKCVLCDNAYKTHHNLKKHYRRSGHKVV